MKKVSYILTLIVICLLYASGLQSTSSKIKIRGTVIRNGQKVVCGVAGNYLKIVCNVKSDIPGIQFFMNINGEQRERSGTGRLMYSFTPTKSDNMKQVECFGRSPLLDTHLQCKVLLDIQYSPVVNVVNEVTETGLTLNCNPSGNPDNYTFANWQHWSEFREHIQNIQGTPEGSLVIREPTNSNRLYENDGIYTCKTSNGVYGANGLLYQKGSALIHNRVAPIFMNANDPIQFGCYGQDIYVSVLLYNKYGTLQTTISNNSKPLNKEGIPKTILMRDMFHGVQVTVAVINITFQLTLDEIDDFTDYTIKACNNKGCNVFTVKVTSKCRPEAPPSVSVNTYARYLNVGWNPGFDGGYLQTFFVEYRQETKNTWKRSGPVVDNRHVKMSKILNDLKPKTRYQVRVFSTNEIGDSNQTVVTSLMTLAECPESPANVTVIPYDRHLEVSWCPKYNGGDPQTFFIEYRQEAGETWTRSGPIIDNKNTTMSDLLYKMTPNTRYLVRMFSRNEIGESKMTTVIDAITLELTNNLNRMKAVFVLLLMMIAVALSKDVCVVVLVALAVTSAVYGLITCFFLRRKAKDASANYNPVDEEVRENFQVEPVDNLLYISSDDHNLARTQNIRNQIVLDTTLSSTSSDNQTIQMQLLNGGLANGRRSCTYINRGTVSAVLNPQIDDLSLNYSEITFNTTPTMRDTVIHGSVNRTIYSEIDLMAEPVAPLSSSESENEKSDDNDT